MAEPEERKCPLSPVFPVTATSEVGSARAQTSNEKEQPSRLDENLLQKMLELQNSNMLRLIETIKHPTSRSDIKLPEFDPEKPDADARVWCNTVDLCFGENPPQGGPLIIAVSSALKGIASQWLSQVSFPGMQWSQFRELFIARYDSVETPAATLINLQNSRPKENECLSVYAARLMTSLTSRWQNMSIEEIAVSTVLAHLTQFDKNLQRLAFMTEIVTRDKLQSELKATAFMKRKLSSINEVIGTDLKRAKTGLPVRCHRCGRSGHHANVCRTNEKRSMGTLASATSYQRSRNICYRCGGVGHFAAKCFRDPGINGGSERPKMQEMGLAQPSTSLGRERQVNVCNVSNPCGRLMNNGESYLFCFDSGAECSLIKESIASKISGKRVNNIVKLTGIGNQSIYSTLQIICQIIISDFNLEI
ncbi:unnamed protein product [Euphydryas editha]|uniref:CCHC-type domain-containing protein n=1 Tax=Euphydryas editha TaxID=104508 RepID=A0AAU9VEF6_EUPED|nr:unnamed protein product [Euphydryas editha]